MRIEQGTGSPCQFGSGLQVARAALGLRVNRRQLIVALLYVIEKLGAYQCIGHAAHQTFQNMDMLLRKRIQLHTVDVQCTQEPISHLEREHQFRSCGETLVGEPNRAPTAIHALPPRNDLPLAPVADGSSDGRRSFHQRNVETSLQ